MKVKMSSKSGRRSSKLLTSTDGTPSWHTIRIVWLMIATMINVYPRQCEMRSTGEKTSFAAKEVDVADFAVPFVNQRFHSQIIRETKPTTLPATRAINLLEEVSGLRLAGPAVRSATFSTNVLKEHPEVLRREEEEFNKISVDLNNDCLQKYDIDSSMLDSRFKGVVGRLHSCKQFWFDSLNSPLFVRGILSQGYVIPFISLPPPVILKNNRSSLSHPTFVADAIMKLLDTGSIVEHDVPPHVVNPLTVSEGKKLRLVLDLRHVNPFTYVSKFKYEGLDILADMFSQNYYFFTFDLESGYHHIDIYEPHQKYLGFSWIFGGFTRFFTFKVLPFGLNTASHCFTKMLRPLVTRWRSMGHSSIMYIDDGISGHSDKISALAASQIVQQDLLNSGFKVNISKSDFTPKQTGEWLGLFIDTISMHFSLPDKKLSKIHNVISECLHNRDQHVSVRTVARIAGFIISASRAIGRLTRLFSRHLYRTIESRTSWSDRILSSAGAIAELEFWHKNLNYINGHPIKPVCGVFSAMYSDASDSGFGGFSVRMSNLVSSGIWSTSESKESSTHREVRAVLYVLRSLGSQLRGMTLKWYSDSQNACRIITVGSTNSDLHNLSIDLYNCCVEFDVNIQTEWLPREFNERADHLSRLIDPDDWSLNRNVFVSLDKKFGPHTVDRFASFYNTQLKRFNSRYWNPGCETADCFTQDWSDENNWICSPASVIINVVNHMMKCKAVGTMIVPEWPSASFWPVLSPQCGSRRQYIVDFVYLPKIADLCIQGRGQSIVYKSKKCLFAGALPFRMLALRLDFRHI